jgi:hypothetical protein
VASPSQIASGRLLSTSKGRWQCSAILGNNRGRVDLYDRPAKNDKTILIAAATTLPDGIDKNKMKRAIVLMRWTPVQWGDDKICSKS